MTVNVQGTECRVLMRPVPAFIAHPDEECDPNCDRCAIVERPDTKESVLVWGYNTGDYGVSRNDPAYRRHTDHFHRTH